MDHTTGEYVAFVVAMLRPIMWFAGGIFVWVYGRKLVRRQFSFPASFIAIGMLLTSVLSAFSALSLSPVVNVPQWMGDLVLFIGTPANAMVIGGIVYWVLESLRFETYTMDRLKNLF